VVRAASRQALEVADALRALGDPVVSRPQLDNILDEVLGPGVAAPDLEAGAAPWSVVERPGQVWGPVSTIIWEGFAAAGDAARGPMWSADELRALEARGVRLDDDAMARRREALAWRRVVRQLADHLVLVAPRRVRDQIQAHHPFWDVVRSAIAPNAEATSSITVDAAGLRQSPGLRLGPLAASRRQVDPLPLPAARRTWSFNRGAVRPRVLESPTSMEQLLGCSLAWTLQYQAGLRRPRFLSIPPEPVMLGNLTHRVVADIFRPDARDPATDVSGMAARLWDAYVPEMAAPLLQPERRLVLERSRTEFVHAVSRLTRMMENGRLVPIATESARRRPLSDEVELEGRLDLLVRRPDGGSAVLDLKWSRSLPRYRGPLAEGRAIQLAAYAWLLNEQDPVPAAYFLLNGGVLLATPHAIFPEESHVRGLSLEDTWATAREAWSGRLEELADGIALATAVGPPDDEKGAVPLVEPPCRYCAYSALCGVGGLS
jgi:RecB family exonuclease